MRTILALIVIILFKNGIVFGKKNVVFFANANDSISGIATKRAFEDAKIEADVDLFESISTDMHAKKDKFVCDAIEEKSPTLILTDSAPDILHEALNKSRFLKIPTLTSAFGQKGDLLEWRDLSGDETKFLTRIMNPLDIIPEVARTIVIKQNHNYGIIVYDSTEYGKKESTKPAGFRRSFLIKIVFSHKLKSIFVNLPIRHTVVPMPQTLWGFDEQLKKFNSLSTRTYYVFGSVQKLEWFMNNTMKKLRVVDWTVFHLITHESNGSINCDCKNLTLIFVRPKEDEVLTKFLENKGIRNDSKLQALFYYDFALNGFRAATSLPEIKNINCSQPSSNQVFDLHDYLELYWRSSLSGYPLNLDENGDKFMGFTMELFGMHYINSNLVRNRSIGTWKAGFGNGLELIYPRVLEEYSGRTLYMIAVVIQKPFLYPNASAPRNFSGLCVDLMEEIGRIANIRYDLYLPEQNTSDPNDNDPFDRAINEVVRGRALMAVGSFWITTQRKQLVDFSVPFHDSVGITIMMKVPEASTSIFKFITVLDGEVWLCILAAYFFTSFILWFFEKFSPISYRNNGEFFPVEGDERVEFTYTECLWFCLNSLTPEGGGLAPGCISGRIVAGIWWLFGFVIIASYTANLAAFLTASSLEAPIESLDDLSKQYQIKYSPINQTSVMVYMENMAKIENLIYKYWFNETILFQGVLYHNPKYAQHEYPIKMKYEKMWRFILDGKSPQSLDEAVKWVRDSRSISEGFALIGDATDIKYLAMTNCDLQVVGDEFAKKPYGIAISKEARMKETVDNAVITLMNERILESMEKKWWKHNPNVVKCDHLQSNGITIHNIMGVFIMIGAGIVFGFFVTFMDKMYNRFMNSTKIDPVYRAESNN